MTLSFSVRDVLRLDVVKPPEFQSYFLLSPFVVPSNGGYQMLLRVVNPSDNPTKKVARVHAAASGGDGLRFTLSPTPSIAPGPSDDDRDGCEDPTAAVERDGWHVYYTGGIKT